MKILVLGDGLLAGEICRQTNWDYISRKKDGIDFTNSKTYVEFFNGYQILHPDYDKIDLDIDPINTGSIVALYPLTGEFKKVKIEHRFFRRLMKQAQPYTEILKDYYEIRV